MNLQQGAKVQGQNEDGIYIDIEQSEFPGMLKTHLTSTMELSSMIYGIFAPIFSDFEGCIVLPDPYSGILNLSLYFKEKGPAGKDQIKNLRNILNPNPRSLDISERIRNFNARNASKTYELTEDTKELLKEFIPTRPGQNINWGQLVNEVTEPTTYGGKPQIYVKVVGIDILRILKKKYGKGGNGIRYDYQLRIEKTLSQYNTGENGNFLISITQLDTKEVERLCNKIGMIPVQGSIAMVRG